MRTLLPGALLVLVMAQPNMATGMMPLYRSSWHLQPIPITVIFAAYLFALVPVLATIGRPQVRSGWWWRIAAGCTASVAADVVMALADSPAIACIARIAAGISVGLVTGSVAGLILERLGERGRTAMATATVLGSAIGTMAAAGFAEYLPAPRVTVYLVHAVLLGVTATTVCADRRVTLTPRIRSEGVTAILATAKRPRRVERPLVGYLCGISAWVSAGLVVALLPSYGAELLATGNVALLALPVTIYLVSAWLAQRVIRPTVMLGNPLVAQAIIIIGVLIAALVPVIPSLAVLIVGGVVAGVGQGLSYRSGLQIISAATEPGEHAKTASRYAAVAYLFAAIATVGFGVVATLASMSAAVLAAAVLLAVILLIGAVAPMHNPITSASSPERSSETLV
jgi:MFS family permease